MLAPNLDAAHPLEIAAADYEIVRRAVEYVNLRFRDQAGGGGDRPRLRRAPRALTDLFRRWCGLTPKDFLQAVTIDAARRVLTESDNVLDAAYELGLSGPGGCTICSWCMNPCRPANGRPAAPGWWCAMASTPRPSAPRSHGDAARLCGLAFADEGEEDVALADMRRRWPNALYIEDPIATAPYAGASSTAAPGARTIRCASSSSAPISR